MANLSWNVNIQVSGGPTITASMAAQPVEATDRVEITISPGDTDKVVDIQPGAATQIRLLMIKSNRYGAAFSFKVRDGTTDSPSVTLDGPQVFTGAGVTLFGRAPHQIKFSNTSSDQTAIVEIFVARDATPEAPSTREPAEPELANIAQRDDEKPEAQSTRELGEKRSPGHGSGGSQISPDARPQGESTDSSTGESH